MRIIASVCSAKRMVSSFAGLLHVRVIMKTTLLIPRCSAGKKKNEDFVQSLVAFRISNISYSDIDDCASAPCQNNDICQDGVNMFICICLNGFLGTFCEISKNNWLILATFFDCLITFYKYIFAISAKTKVGQGPSATIVIATTNAGV